MFNMSGILHIFLFIKGYIINNNLPQNTYQLLKKPYKD